MIANLCTLQEVLYGRFFLSDLCDASIAALVELERPHPVGVMGTNSSVSLLRVPHRHRRQKRRHAWRHSQWTKFEHMRAHTACFVFV